MKKTVDWFRLSGEPHTRTFQRGCRLSSLAHDWQRELAALWRLEADVNNGAYLQFLSNWGRESYLYASQALKKIGARKMAKLIDQCQALIDKHAPAAASYEELLESLPKRTSQRILELSYQFMEYPDNIEALGLAYYVPLWNERVSRPKVRRQGAAPRIRREKRGKDIDS